MCPDQQLLSIYLDGELPSPWREKMRDHFAQCSECREKLENFRRLKELFKKDKGIVRTFVERVVDEPAEERTYTEQELIDAAQKRVWNKVASRRTYSTSHGNVWQRRLSIPIPAAAAAVVVITLMAVFGIRSTGTLIANNRAEPAERASFILAAEEEIQIPAFLPVSDMNMSGMLQYLTNDSTNIIILQLPEDRSFTRAGEPAMIRAADFSRNGQPQGNRQPGNRQSNTRRHP